MCFSPEADLTAAAVVGAVGVATLRELPSRRELLLGALPMLFALHQGIETLVWLGLRGEVSAGAASAARTGYVLFAQAVLPVLVPLAFLVAEPRAARRRLWALVAVGAGLGGYLLWQDTAFPIGASVQEHCIAYTTHAPDALALGVLYAIATCAPALLSGHPRLRAFGVLNVAGVIVAALVRYDELTSVWCAYAALASVLVWLHFRRERAGLALLAGGS